MSELWVSKAIERHVQLDLDVDQLLTSHDMLASVVGQDWLDEQADIVQRSGSPFEASPLYRILVDPTEVALVETCELALYLQTFKNDPAIQTVIDDLKSQKYEAVLFELGLAYRWRVAGANITLRPVTPKGRVADYAATISDVTFTVEASSFPGGDATRIPFLAARCVESTLKKDIPANVKIRIAEYPSGNFDALLHSRIRAACLEFRKNFQSGSRTFESTESFGSIEVEAIGPGAQTNPITLDEHMRIVSVREHEWHAVIECRSISVDEAEPLYRRARSQADADASSIIFVRFPGEDRDVFKELRTKLQVERKQLSGVLGPRVIALDATLLADTLQLDQAGLRSMVLPFLRSVPSLACIWLEMRRWQTSLRYRYEGLYIENPESAYRLPNSFVSNLFNDEWQVDFLTGKTFAPTSEADARHEYARRMQ